MNEKGRNIKIFTHATPPRQNNRLVYVGSIGQSSCIIFFVFYIKYYHHDSLLKIKVHLSLSSHIYTHTLRGPFLILLSFRKVHIGKLINIIVNVDMVVPFYQRIPLLYGYSLTNGIILFYLKKIHKYINKVPSINRFP